MIKPRRIGHATFETPDLEKAIAYYEKFMGLVVAEREKDRAFLMSKIDEFCGPKAFNHYAVGWAHAMNTPYQWTKQVASHWGGTRNGTIVHWPKGIQGKAEIRKINVARDQGVRLEVAAGVRAGERVILNSPADLVDGSKVQVAAQ